MSCRAKENVFNAESVIRLHCPFQNCGKFYKNKKNLNEHHRLYPKHKPGGLPGGLPTPRKRVSLTQCAEKFLDDESNSYSRKQRVGELLNCLNDEELVDFIKFYQELQKLCHLSTFYCMELMELVIFTANCASSEMYYFCASQNLKHCFVQTPHQALGSRTRGNNYC